MAASGSTKDFCHWMAATDFEDLPPDVRHMVSMAIYDCVGGWLACSMLPLAHRMVDFINLAGGSPDCSVAGFPGRTSVLNAAVVNGTLGHGDEVDAIEGDGLGAHILAAPAAAALAAAQMAEAPGQQALRGVVFGYELAKRLNRAAARARGETGRVRAAIDPGNTMGATAAAGIALGLSQERMEVAFGLAAAMTCGVTPFGRETEHMLKSFVRGGVGARNGVAAALMSKAGYDAPEDIFEGPQGLFHGRIGVEDPGPDFLKGLGEDYAIRGIVFKRVCGGGPNQAPKQALLEMMSKNRLAARDIAEINVEVEPAGHNTITHVHHPSIEGKDVLALAAVYGGRGFKETYTPSACQNPEVQSLRERISVSPRKEWSGHEDHFRTVVTLKTRNGRTLREEVRYRYMDDADLDAKFRDLVTLRAGEAKARELAPALKGLDTAANTAEVMQLVEMPAAHLPGA
ncbi:MAG: MmgE/PrpD family protein [SAR202 cluster bacterium]|nr:MmgE/PrpD family protein [SAR202 cluster bacterium]